MILIFYDFSVRWCEVDETVIDDNTNTDLFDADFTISSLKDINEGSYHYWNPSLQECLNQIGQRATTNYSSRKITEKNDSDYKLN